MVRIQNESLEAQIQILKTNIFSIFAFRDAAYEGTEFLNAFHESVINFVQSLKDMIVQGEEGEQTLTEFGKSIQTKATAMVEGFQEVMHDLIDAIEKLMELNLQQYFKLILVPLKVMAGAVKWLGDTGLLNLVLGFKALQMMGITAMLGGIANAFFQVAKGAGFATFATSSFGQSMGLGVGAMARGGTSAKDAAIAQTLFQDTAGRWRFKGMTGGSFNTQEGLFAKHGKLLTGGPRAAGMTRWGAMLGFGGPILGMLGMGLLLKGIFDYANAANGGYLQGMHGGGSMSGGTPYLVGEQGPELFVPGASGQLLNNGQTQGLYSRGIVLKDVSIGIDSFGGLA
jgi:hypothetical protein